MSAGFWVIFAIAGAFGVGFILGADYVDWKFGRPRS